MLGLAIYIYIEQECPIDEIFFFFSFFAFFVFCFLFLFFPSVCKYCLVIAWFFSLYMAKMFYLTRKLLYEIHYRLCVWEMVFEGEWEGEWEWELPTKQSLLKWNLSLYKTRVLYYTNLTSLPHFQFWNLMSLGAIVDSINRTRAS